ncbi:MBL fold metallo-hydrolase [Chitinophaga lutea]|uniref:MBL fold metallo-hydrolase n=1 Tax=Chitinophaga lutea TaxID=2488634 RepID=A0A3N4PJN5_9BACT|nr:MBL fold metallo-hydrolase [Chitinophaga lutea]RPE08872.1 MBL fold metallo-hydrolase [Chitinophaga lutea]
MTRTNTLQLIRNATLVLQYAGRKILVDPMFFPKDAYDSLAGIARNPTIDLTVPVDAITRDLDGVLVTHTHRDHFDAAASQALDKSITLLHQPADEAYFEKENFTNAAKITDETHWNGIHIIRTGGRHGSGEILLKMGEVSGFVLKAEGAPTVYIVGDSIWLPEIADNIHRHRPDYIVINSGGAVIPGHEHTPILMQEEQAIALIRAGGNAKVIAVHMEALDHCRTTRASLRAAADAAGISSGQLLIPADGEVLIL